MHTHSLSDQRTQTHMHTLRHMCPWDTGPVKGVWEKGKRGAIGWVAVPSLDGSVVPWFFP